MSEGGQKLHQYIAAACMCLGALGIGTAIGWTSNITNGLKAGELNEIDMEQEQLGWIGSLMTLGAMFMCFPVGWMVDALGRKPTVLINIIPFSVGWILVTFGTELTLAYAGRFLIGVACGSFCVVAPLYNSEIAHSSIRGAVGTFFQLFINIGILFCGVLGYAMPLLAFNVSCFCIPLVFGLCFVSQPETPVYDLRVGRTERAERTFKRLRGPNYDCTQEIEEIIEEIDREKERHSFRKVMQTRAAKRAILICFMLMFYQQLCGVYAVMFYSQDIFHDSGSTLKDSFCTIVLQTVQVIATGISTLTIDRFGRKMLLIISAGLMSVSTGCLGLYFSLKNLRVYDEEGIKSISYIPLVSLNVFIIAYSIGFGPIPWLASTEMFSPEIKAKCTSAAVTFNWFLAFLVTKFYFSLANSIGIDVTFYIFAIISATAVFFVVSCIPETRGKTFIEIQEALEN